MSILEVNNNILRESELTLKIINGETAEVYPGYDNKDLNTNGYWKDFLQNSDSITIPIKSIDSMTKSKSIWYRNKEVKDSCFITVSNDYNNNIIEFLNKGIKNKYLDFDSLEQLIFIVELAFINSVGYTSKTPIFVGRPTIKSNTDKILKFEINNLDYILKGSEFNSNVLDSPTASFYNYISLKESFERIINTPHDLDDDYSYPVCPFNVAEDVFIPSSAEYLKETELLPQGYEVYAEDYIEGDYNRKQLFFYADSPTCGIVDISFSDDNNYITTDPFWMKDIKFFTNDTDGVNWTGDSKKLVDNLHRCFRPIKSFIAPADNNSYSIAELDGTLLAKSSPSSEFGISKDDEIIVVEQLVEVMRKDDDTPLNNLVFFNNNSNIYYYNRTKNIFYWEAIISQAETVPFPELWLDLRLDGYFGLDIVYNTYYHGDDVDSGYWKGRIFSSYPFMINMGGDGTYYYMRNSSRLNNMPQFIVRSLFSANAIYPSGVLHPADDVPTSVITRMDMIKEYKPKAIRFTDDFKFEFVYQNIDGTFNSYKTVLNKCDWNRAKIDSFTSVEYEYTVAQLEDKTFIERIQYITAGYYLEINKHGGNQFMFSHKRALSITEDVFQLHYPVIIRVDLETPRPSMNFYAVENGFCMFPRGNFIRQYDGYSDPLDSTDFGGTVLDINFTENTVIVKRSSKLFLLETNGTTIFEGVIPFYDDNLLACDRDTINIYSESENVYYNNQKNSNQPVRLLSYEDNRYKGMIGLGNSFFKNMYNDNLGIKQIGTEDVNAYFTINDDMINSINVNTTTYNKIEYNKASTIKNSFTGVDNDDSSSKDEDDQNYDEATSINMYSTTDIDVRVTIKRTQFNIEYNVYNEFVDIDGIVDLGVSPDYSSFEIDLTGTDLDGVTIFVNFYDTELAIGKSFRGQVNRRELQSSSVKDEVVSLNNKYIWRNDNTLGLKFPFLVDKYSKYFNDEMADYFTDENGNIRKVFNVDIEIKELILFYENYGIFNIGEKRVSVDSLTKYLNGYGYSEGKLIALNNNKCWFEIEKVVYNFKARTTKLTLVSV